MMQFSVPEADASDNSAPAAQLDLLLYRKGPSGVVGRLKLALAKMADELLANPVIEDYEVRVG